MTDEQKDLDEKLEKTIRAAMDKLRALRDPPHKVERFKMYTASPEARRVFLRITRKWWQFWRAWY
jgi:hypothetical protein